MCVTYKEIRSPQKQRNWKPFAICVNLSLEAKDGNDFMIFSYGKPSGPPAWHGRAWIPSSTPSRPTTKRRKTPSQHRRDLKRREEFLSRKRTSANLDIKKESSENEQVAKATLETPIDEIHLMEIPDECDKTDMEKCANEHTMLGEDFLKMRNILAKTME